MSNYGIAGGSRECHSKCTSAFMHFQILFSGVCKHASTQICKIIDERRERASERRLSIKSATARDPVCDTAGWRFARCARAENTRIPTTGKFFRPIRGLTRRIIKMAVSQIYAPLVASRCQITT